MSDDDLAGLGGRLQAARRVHDVAHHGGIATRAHRADEHLTGVDADAQREAVPGLVRDPVERLSHRDPAPHGALGVVLVRGRCPELGHDLVADDLVEAATVRGDHVDERLEAAVDKVLDGLGVGGLRQGRESHDVGHEHGDEPALVGPAQQRMSAIRAEARAGRNVLAARRAVHGVMPVGRGGMRWSIRTRRRCGGIRSRTVRALGDWGSTAGPAIRSDLNDPAGRVVPSCRP